MEEYVHHQDSVLVDMVGLETDVKIVSYALCNVSIKLVKTHVSHFVRLLFIV